MKNGLLKFSLATVLLTGASIAQATKMTRHITHGVPWIETRLSYSMTAKELAQNYYGNVTEVSEILKINKNIESGLTLLYKDMTVHIPVTDNFTDQPELLGWRE